MKSLFIVSGRVLVLIFVLVFYFWTVTAGRLDSGLFIKYGYYNFLTDAFLDGHVHLSLDPKPELLLLSDPYDPVLNKEYKVWDFSLYKDKYYLYFGPTPVIFLYLPYKLITRQNFSDNLAILIFGFGALLWATLLLIHFKNNYFNYIKEWMLLCSILIVGIANAVPMLLARPFVYEVAISCGCFFLCGALYFLCISASNSKPKIWSLFLSGLFFGLGIGARPHIFLSGFLLILLFLLLVLIKRHYANLDKLKIGLALLFPFLLCSLLIATYNYLRFENIFEFGIRYQLTGMNNNKFKLWGFEYVLKNLYYYLFSAPSLSYFFPFILTEYRIPPNPPFVPGITLPERIVGLFPGVPFVWLLFICPFIQSLFFRYNSTQTSTNNLRFPYFLFSIIILPGIVNLIVLVSYLTSIIRYCADYFTYFILATCIVLFYYDGLIRQSFIKLFFRLLTLILVLITLYFGFAFSITGTYFDLKVRNPQCFKTLENNFMPVSSLMKKLLSAH